jgi:protein TonB
MPFELFLTHERQQPKKGRRIMYTVSMGLHVAVLIVGVIYSFWHVDELSPPMVSVTFMAAAPPPPPPPPPKKKTTPKKPRVEPTEVVQPKPDEIVQPKEEPIEEDQGADDGVEGGVEGGIAGGVVTAAPPPPPPPQAPKFLPPNVADGQRLTDPQDPRYRAVLPPALARAGMRVWALVKLCVDKDGAVVSATILKGADPLVDPEIVSKLKLWKYRPYSVDGRPVPFCTNVRYVMSAT